MTRRESNFLSGCVGFLGGLLVAIVVAVLSSVAFDGKLIRLQTDEELLAELTAYQACMEWGRQTGCAMDVDAFVRYYKIKALLDEALLE